ncbi:hypothetical protein HMSSN139_64970 [Paenibacillus sp. HMSSN-139]|nr:hypothetical protein HMSSN139_64970 [Paenibacillus sp. HMSSN-139]
MELREAIEIIGRIRRNIGEVVVGKEEVVDLLLAALLGNGHVLLEDVPGTGKTLWPKRWPNRSAAISSGFNLRRTCCLRI